MRRITSAALPLIAALVAGLVASCSEEPMAPTRGSTPGAAHIPVSLATASTASGATFTTDKDDYAPGDTLKLTGAGWQAGDTLDIHLDEDPQNHAPVDWAVGVDENGGFRDSSYVVQEIDAGVTFALTATSRATGETATATFTDGTLNGVSLDTASRSVAQTGSVSYKVNVDMGGNGNACTITLSVLSSPGLPSGANPSIPNSTVSLTAPNGNVDFFRTLTITTTTVTPGTYPFKVQAAPSASCGGSTKTADGTLIVFGPATHLGFLQPPSDADAGVAIDPAVTVGVLDANNNVVANSSASIGLAFGSNPGSGTLSGTFPKNASSGVATFDDLSINKSGAGYTLIANSSGLTSATSSSFDIKTGDVSQLEFTTQPSGAIENTAFTTQPVVAIEDAAGNVKTIGTGSGVNVTLEIASGGASGAALSCATNPLGASHGIATYGGCRIDKPGTDYVLRARITIGGDPISVLSSPFNVDAANRKPVADAGTYTDQDEGAEITLDGSGSSDPDGDAITYQWSIVSFTPPAGKTGQCSFKNGISTGVSPKVICNDNGSLVVGLIVNEGSLSSDEDQATITVKNVAPTVTLSPSSKVIDEGGTASYTATIDDPGTNDAVSSYAWTPTTGNCTVTSSTQTSATYTCVDDFDGKVKLTVKDDDDGEGSGEASLKANNVVPTITSVTPSGVNTNNQLILGSNNQVSTTVTFNFSDPAGTYDQPYASSIDCGNGTTITPSAVNYGSSSSGDCTYTASQVGQHTISATVTDNDNGTSDAVTVMVYVIYDWNGFFQPVDNTHLNVAKAGSAIPVKFNLGAYQALDILADRSPASKVITCSTIYEAPDAIEETVNAGNSSLTYDYTANQYIYVWKSDKTWQGTCRRLDLKLKDGTTHSAYFQWTKF